MHEAEGMDKLDGERGRHRALDGTAGSARALEHEDRAEPLAALEDRVQASCAQIVGEILRGKEVGECALDGVKQHGIKGRGGA